MAGIFSLRNWVMKQLMKTDKSGIIKIPPKGKVDFGEMLLREQLFKKGIDPKIIKNEKQLDNILDTPVVPKSERVKPKKTGEVIEVDFDKNKNWFKGKSEGTKSLFATDKEFADELRSLRLNIIRNDPQFNLEIAESYKLPGGKTYAPYPDKEPGKLLSPTQRQNMLDEIKNLMKDDEYRSQFGGDFNFEEITDEMFRIKKAQGGRTGLSYLLAEDTNERIPYVFGGRTIGVLKNLLTKFKKSSGIPRGEKTLKPDVVAKRLMSEEDKLKLLQFETQYANNVLEHLKADRQLFKQLQANKEMKDEGLDFLMKNFVETQAPHMKNYKNLADIDQAILELETLVKNKTLKEGRQLNAEGGRIALGAGGGLPPISGNWNVDFKTHEGSHFPIPGLTISEGGYSGNVGGNINFPVGQGNVGLEGLLGFGRNKFNVDYKGQNVASGVGETKLGDVWNVGAEYNRPLWGGTIGISGSLDQSSNKQGNIFFRKKFAGGGMGRRAFLKLMAALGATGVAAKSGLVSLLGKGGKKQVAKNLTQVPIKNIEGMPAWFKPLVNKVIKEGTEVPSGAERVIVHKTKLPNSKTDVYVNQDLNTGDVWVDLGVEKHGFADGKFGQPVRLEYKAKEIIEPDIDDVGKVKSKGKEVPEEFNVEEAEFTGGHPENIKFEESVIEKFGDHASNFDEVEMFATGKIKKSKPTKKAEKLEYEIGKAEADAEAAADMADDFASGGIARMLGE